MENYLPMGIVMIGITIMLISVGIFLFKYKPKRKIRTPDPEFKNTLYSSTQNAIRELEAKKSKMNNGFKIGDIVVVVISDEKYSGKIVNVEKNNRCRVYISDLEIALTFKSSDITLK